MTDQKTFSAKPDDVERQWFVVDASEIPLGRLASAVAEILRGKHKPIYTPHVDTGDYVIVVNARDVRLTGNKAETKQYIRHSGYPGGLSKTPYGEFREEQPDRMVEKAVRGMLPKNSLGRKMIKKLKVYGGEDHPHEAQQPEPLELDVG